MDTNKLDDNISVKLEEIVKKEGYTTYDIKKRDSNSEGHMGSVLIFDIKGKTQHGEKEINVFVKQIVHPKIQMIYDVPNIFKREKLVYTNLFKEMSDLQEKFDVPLAERFKAATVFDESTDKIIILENLAAKGFKTYGAQDIVNFEYTALAITALAKLHGLSLAMQIKRPEYFEKHIKSMDCVYIFDEYFQRFQHNIRKIAMQFLSETLREKLEQRLIKAVDMYKIYMNDDTCAVKTVCHGDFRASNVMVKEIDGKPVEVVPVDYQITFLGNPVLDFIYFIFWGTDQEFRRKYLETLKNIYYNNLSTFLSYFSIITEEVFPRAEFEKQYQEKLDFGLMISLFYLPVLFPKDDELNLEEIVKPLDQMELKIDEKFGERFRGIIDDFMKWGYL